MAGLARRSPWLHTVLLVLIIGPIAPQHSNMWARGVLDSGVDSAPGDTWAIVVCTSRFWHNYRHAANAVAVYGNLRRLGVPKDNIILMLADDFACNPRNPFPGQIFADQRHEVDLYPEDAHVMRDITVAGFLGVLTGCEGDDAGEFKISGRGPASHLLVYLSGHGGDGFLKFQDREELSAKQLAAGFAELWAARQYSQAMLIVDTCQAASMLQELSSPGIVGLASSAVGENSYSHHMDPEIGVATIDRFTFHLATFLGMLEPKSNVTVGDLVDYLRSADLKSTLCVRADQVGEDLHSFSLLPFFNTGDPYAKDTTHAQ